MSFIKDDFTIKKRQRWMAVLSRSSCRELESAWQEISEKPNYHYLRKLETDSIMIRGRAGGSGVRFNLGEITVTRCTIKTGKGFVGISYVMGRDSRRAELAALFDAMLQDLSLNSPH
jgi:alpha-D-ribose 1-methylphosphonate 5-triphosphate synthase subunit PhnG